MWNIIVFLFSWCGVLGREKQGSEFEEWDHLICRQTIELQKYLGTTKKTVEVLRTKKKKKKEDSISTWG